MSYHRRFADKVLVATCFGQLSKPFLHPSRSIKYITDESGFQITQDVLVLLENVDIEHPVGQYVRDVCQSFVKQYKTGGAYLLHFIGSWTRAAQLLCDMGIPSALVIDLLQSVVNECIEHTATHRVMVKDALFREKERKTSTKNSDSCNKFNKSLDSFKKYSMKQEDCSEREIDKGPFTWTEDDNSSGTTDSHIVQPIDRSNSEEQSSHNLTKVSSVKNYYVDISSGIQKDQDGASNVDNLKLSNSTDEEHPKEDSMLDLMMDQFYSSRKWDFGSSVAKEKKEIDKHEILYKDKENTLKHYAEDRTPVNGVTSIDNNISLSQNNVSKDEETIDGIKIVRLEMKDHEQEEIEDDISWFFKHEGDHALFPEQDIDMLLTKSHLENKKSLLNETRSEDEHSTLVTGSLDVHSDINHILEQAKSNNSNEAFNQNKFQIMTNTDSDEQHQEMQESYEGLKEELEALKIGIEMDIATVKQKKKKCVKTIPLENPDEFDSCFKQVDDEFETCFDNSVRRSVIWNGAIEVHNENMEAVDSEFQEVELVKPNTSNNVEKYDAPNISAISSQNEDMHLVTQIHVSQQVEIDPYTSDNYIKAVNIECEEPVRADCNKLYNLECNKVTSEESINGFQKKKLSVPRELCSANENIHSSSSGMKNVAREDTVVQASHSNIVEPSAIQESKKANNLVTNNDKIMTVIEKQGNALTEKKMNNDNSDEEFESLFDDSEMASVSKTKVSDFVDLKLCNMADDKPTKVTMLGLDNLLQGLGKAVKKPASSLNAISMSSRHLTEDKDISNKTLETEAENVINTSEDIQQANQTNGSIQHNKGLKQNVINANQVSDQSIKNDLVSRQEKIKQQKSEHSERHSNKDTGVTVKGINDLLKNLLDKNTEPKSVGKPKSNVLLMSRHFKIDDTYMDASTQLPKATDYTETIYDNNVDIRNELLQFVAKLNFGLDERFHNVLTDVVLRNSTGKDLSLLPQYIQVCGLAGRYREPTLVNGVVMKVSHFQASKIHRLQNRSCRVLIVNADIKSTYKHKGYKAMKTTKVFTVDAFADHVTEKDKWLQEVSDILIEFNINVVLTRGSISGEFQLLCEENDVVAMECVPYQQLTLISEAAKVTMVTYITLATEDNICQNVSLSPWEPDTDHITKRCIQGTCKHAVTLCIPSCNPQTVVIQNHTQTLVDLEEEAFMDSLYRTSSALSSGYVLQGAGATEIACANMCFTRAENLTRDLDNPGFSDIDIYRPTVFKVMAKTFQEYARLVQEHSNHFFDRTLDCAYDDYHSKVEAWRTAIDTVCVLMSSDMFVVTGISEDQYSRMGNFVL